jgi:cell division protein FtsI/penicillin-binding protein 2
MQRIPGGVWMPVNDDDDEVAAKDGADIISTINVNFQDVAQDALKKQLVKSAGRSWLCSADGSGYRRDKGYCQFYPHQRW